LCLITIPKTLIPVPAITGSPSLIFLFIEICGCFQFSKQREYGKGIYESVRDERQNEKDGRNAILSRWERGVPGKATCKTGLFLKPG